jgi:hypothetical protein
MKSLKAISVSLMLYYCIFGAINATAGEKFLTAKRASIWFGTRELSIENTPSTNKLDFLDYANNYHMGEYFILGISIQMQGRGPFTINLDVFTSDDIIPTSFHLGYQYNLLPWLGFNAGFMQYPFLITGYDDFYRNTDTEFLTDGGSDANLRQSTHHDFAFTFGPSINLEGSFGFVSLQLNGAYSSLLPFVASFRQKKIESNLRREVIYKTDASSSFFLFPSLRIGTNIAQISNKSLGIELYASTYMGNRKIDYSKTVRQWIEENAQSEQFSNRKHAFQKTDISLGLYLRF